MLRKSALRAVSLMIISGVLFCGCSNRTQRLRKQADRAYAERDFNDAGTLYAKLLEESPEETEAQFFLGVCLQMQKDYSGAIAEFTGVLRKDSAAYNAALNRGHCHYALEAYENAKVDYQTVLRIKPGYGLALNPLAHMYFYLGDTTAACQTLIEAGKAFANRELDPELRKACASETPLDSPEVQPD